MIRTRRQSFTWPFCLSMACILSWFIPVEALFAVPIPHATDGEPPAMTRYQVPEPTRWIRQYERVFGAYEDGQPFDMPSASAWDGASIHLLVTEVGPCIYIPTTSIDITTEVRTEQPSTTADYISTSGWLSGPQGVFPTSFAVLSENDQSIFYFSGTVPASTLSSTNFDLGDGAELPEASAICTEGVTALDAADTGLDSMLAGNGSKQASGLRALLSDHVDQIETCWEQFELAMSVIRQQRDLAISTARSNYAADLEVAKEAFVKNCALAEVVFLSCLVGAGLGNVAAPVLIGLCFGVKAAVITSHGITYTTACNRAKRAFEQAVEVANAQYRLATIPIKHALEKCLAAVNDQIADEACFFVTVLPTEVRSMIDQHQGAYQAIGAQHADCFLNQGGHERINHGFHIAIATCSFE